MQRDKIHLKEVEVQLKFVIEEPPLQKQLDNSLKAFSALDKLKTSSKMLIALICITVIIFFVN